jgi:glycosyltransferase involved in cell wall biosynthesis
VVAPRLPPEICGVGNYAWELHRAWPLPRPISWLVLFGADASRRAWPNENIHSFAARAGEFETLLSAQPGRDVLLHYAGRAYDRFGFPFWMAEGFARWEAKDPGRRLHVVFHELAAHLPLLSRQGILQRLSFRVARRLANLATTLITNSEHHAGLLKAWVPASDVHWFPVPSNIPPPAPDSGLGKRKRGEFLVFGLAFSRLQTVQLFRDWISSWAKIGRLRRLHLIGPRDEKFSAQADHLLAECLPADAVVQHGALPPGEVSQRLLEAEFCLSPASKFHWSKSGSFMAFAAHACPVVTTEQTPAPLNQTIAPNDVATISESEAEKYGAALREWYAQNADWKIVAKRIANFM